MSQPEGKVDVSLVHSHMTLSLTHEWGLIAVYGRPDLALTVLGEPAAGTAVGM